MQSENASRGTLKTVLLATAAVLGLALVAFALLGSALAGGSDNDDVSVTGAASFGSTAPQANVSLTERDDPWPAGVVAEMIAASDPEVSMRFRTEVIGQCMSQQGLQYIADLEAPTFHADRLDRESVARHGFGIGIESPSETVAMSPNNEMLVAMDQESADAWTVTQNNCVNEANTADQQLLEEHYALLPAAMQQEIVELRFYDHPALSEPLEQWAQCMLAAGFDVPHPFVMLDQLAKSYNLTQTDTAALQEQERQLALANYDCRYDILAPAFVATLDRIEVNASEILQTNSLYNSALEALQQ